MGKKEALVKFLLLIIAIGMAYHTMLKAEFIMDDQLFYLDDPVMNDPHGLAKIWFHPLELSGPWPYLPVTRSFFWLERQIFGLNLTISHFINILLHSLSAVLLWRGLHAFRIQGAWLVSMIFAVHPVLVQTVAWISDRKNLTAGVFFLLCIWSYQHFEKNRRVRWYLVALGLFAIALLSKTSTIMLPVVLVLCRIWWGYSWNKQDVFRLVPLWGLAGVAAYGRIWFEVHRFGAGGVEYAWSWLERVLIAGHIPFFYLRQLVFPSSLNFIYRKWQFDFMELPTYLPTLSILVLAGILWRKRRDWGVGLALGLASFVVLLFPVLGFFNNSWTRFSFVADHWVYLPCLPILILLVQGTIHIRNYWNSLVHNQMWVQRMRALHFKNAARPRKLPPTLRRQPRSRFGLRPRRSMPKVRTHPRPNHLSQVPSILFQTSWSGILVVLGLLTWNQTQAYRDLPTLWQATLQNNPYAWIAYLDLARISKEQGDFEQALVYLESFETLLLPKGALPPYYALMYNNRGNVYTALGKHDLALREFHRALNIDPHYADAFNNRGTVHAQRRQYELALKDYNKALELRPDHLLAYLNRGLTYYNLKQYDQALHDLSIVIQRNPAQRNAYLIRGDTWLALGKNDAACIDFQEACRLGACEDWNSIKEQNICKGS